MCEVHSAKEALFTLKGSLQLWLWAIAYGSCLAKGCQQCVLMDWADYPLMEHTPYFSCVDVL